MRDGGGKATEGKGSLGEGEIHEYKGKVREKVHVGKGWESRTGRGKIKTKERIAVGKI